MKARATLGGHPIHQILIPLPLGLLVGAVIFDIIAVTTTTPELSIVAFWNMVAGVLTGLLAALFGIIDWTKIPRRTRAKRLGVWHALANVAMIVVFAIAAVLRVENAAYAPTLAILALEIGAFVLAGIGGWMGGHLVDHYGIGVDSRAHPDLGAPGDDVYGVPARPMPTGATTRPTDEPGYVT